MALKVAGHDSSLHPAVAGRVRLLTDMIPTDILINLEHLIDPFSDKISSFMRFELLFPFHGLLLGVEFFHMDQNPGLKCFG